MCAAARCRSSSWLWGRSRDTFPLYRELSALSHIDNRRSIDTCHAATRALPSDGKHPDIKAMSLISHHTLSQSIRRLLPSKRRPSTLQLHPIQLPVQIALGRLLHSPVQKRGRSAFSSIAHYRSIISPPSITSKQSIQNIRHHVTGKPLNYKMMSSSNVPYPATSPTHLPPRARAGTAGQADSQQPRLDSSYPVILSPFTQVVVDTVRKLYVPAFYPFHELMSQCLGLCIGKETLCSHGTEL